jgi:hypothetical protein
MNWSVPAVQGVRPVCLLHCRSFFACEEDVRTFHFCTSCCDRIPVILGFWSGFYSLKKWEWCIQIPYWSGGMVRLILHDTLVLPLPWSFLILHAGMDISSILNAERLVMSDCTFKQQVFWAGTLWSAMLKILRVALLATEGNKETGTIPWKWLGVSWWKGGGCSIDIFTLNLPDDIVLTCLFYWLDLYRFQWLCQGSIP